MQTYNLLVPLNMLPIPPWSDLPLELLSTIENLLTSNPFNVLAFRSVCKSWRSSYPSTSSPPILSPLLPFITRTVPRRPFDIIKPLINKWCVLYVTVVYSFRPPVEDPLLVPNTWICLVDQVDKDELRVREAFSQYYSRPFGFPESLNMLDFHASELGRFYNLDIMNMISKQAWKVILLSDMSAALILSEEGILWLIWLETTEHWEIIHDGTGYHIHDVIEFKGMILGVDGRGRVYEIRLQSDKSFTIHRIVPTPAGMGGKRMRLVESLGKLYLVDRCRVDQIGVAFKVYRLLLDENEQWEQVTGIGDTIFIFIAGFSLSVSTQQLGGIYPKNCILYDSRSFGRGYDGYDPDDSKLFKGLYDHKIGVCHLEDAARIAVIGSNHGYSKMFWPTPSWLIGSVRDHS